MKCPYDNTEAEWVENKEVYGRNFGKSWMIWLCRTCGARVGCHNNTKKPLGTMAQEDLRKTRIRTHAIIDQLWKSGKFKRQTVYKKLSDAFGEEIHIGESDKNRCREIIEKTKIIFTL